MKRRQFITLLGGAWAAWPLSAHAQQHERVRHLGVLMRVEEGDPEGKAQLFGFTQVLAQLGSTDGRNLRMEIRWAELATLTVRATSPKGLIALQPDAILAQGTPVTAALHRETQTIPIVSVVVTDPVGDGFVGSRRECSIGTPRFFAFSPGRRAKSCPLRFRGHCSRVSC
jgi:putative tryptophan/tyrosine transport system substrate-binding protein